MSKSNIAKEVKYPGWPSNQDWPPLSVWEQSTEPTNVPLGEGLFGSGISFPQVNHFPPHPEFVKQWRQKRDETVSNTAIYFGLTDVQVLEACR